jgi:hypothetical protein
MRASPEPASIDPVSLPQGISGNGNIERGAIGQRCSPWLDAESSFFQVTSGGIVSLQREFPVYAMGTPEGVPSGIDILFSQGFLRIVVSFARIFAAFSGTPEGLSGNPAQCSAGGVSKNLPM